MLFGNPAEIRAEEKRIAKIATDKFKGVEFFDAPGRFCVVDGLLTLNGEMWCFVEIKKRNISSTEYPHIIIDKKKIDQAWEGASKLGLGFKLLFEFVDGAFVFTFCMKSHPSKVFQSCLGGRTFDKREENDIDEVYNLPSQDWRKI